VELDCVIDQHVCFDDLPSLKEVFTVDFDGMLAREVIGSLLNQLFRMLRLVLVRFNGLNCSDEVKLAAPLIGLQTLAFRENELY